MLFICYSGCATCKKARSFLDRQDAIFVDRDIKTERPTADELALWIAASGLPVKKWFNAAGLVYKEQNLKEKLPLLDETEQLALLASDGMLVRRPILVLESRVLVGFKPDEWQAAIAAEEF